MNSVDSKYLYFFEKFFFGHWLACRWICFGEISIDGLVKSLQLPIFVIPAKAGIHFFHVVTIPWTPVFTGVTTFYKIISFN
jgi:hypothetical protein